jgi:multiple sugar transport system substrate-binding protein
MATDNDESAPSDTESDNASEGDVEQQGYSRRGFMQAASAMGAAGAAGLAGCTGDGGSGDGGSGDGGSGDGGSGDGGAETTSSDGDDGGSTEQKSEQNFIFWTMRGYIPEVTQGIKGAASGFEDYSDSPVSVSTNVIVWSQVFPKWNASIQGRTTPNVSEMANEHAVNFGSLGATAPITDIYDSYDDWYGPMDAWTAWDDKRWGVPWFVETRPLYYRTDLLEEIGQDKPPETWKELIRWGQKYVEQSDNPAYLEPGARDFSTGQHTFSYTAQAGGEFYTKQDGKWKVKLDSGDSLFGHLFYASLGKQWDLMPGGWSSMDGTATDKYFREEDALFGHLGAEDARLARTEEHADLKDKVGIRTMPAGPNGENWSFRGGSCLSPFNDEVAKNEVGDLSNEFVKYMMQPEKQSEYFQASAPVFMPVREAQEEMELFANNPTKLPDSWLDAFVEQAAETRRYGVYGGGQNEPFLGAVEGSTTGYSQAMSGILGSDNDPKEALVSMANSIRDSANKKLDYTLKANNEQPSLDDAPDMAQDWITGSNDTPKIWNPYE